jgi:DNA repair protein RadC
VHLSAVDVAKILMQQAGNDLNQLARLSIKDLMKIRGIGEAKAVAISAAMELGRRRQDQTPQKRLKITSPKTAFEAMKPYLLDLPHEEFWIILINRANEVIKPVQISIGGISGTVTDTRKIFKIAIECLASGVILVHNHPSGQLIASKADKQLTGQLQEAGRILDLPIIDHVIFTDHGYLSFKDEGML